MKTYLFKLFSCFFSLLFITASYCQSLDIQKFDKLNRDDKLKLFKTQLQKCIEIEEENSFNKRYQTLLSFCRDNEFEKGEALCKNYLFARYIMSYNELDTTKSLIDEIEEHYFQILEPTDKVSFRTYKAQFYQIQFNYKKVLEEANKIEGICDKYKLNKKYVYNLKGVVYNRLQNQKKSKDYLRKAVAEAHKESEMDINFVEDMYEAISIICIQSYQDDSAIFYINKALEIKPDGIQSLMTKGSHLTDMGKYKEALKIFDQVHALVNSNNDIPHFVLKNIKGDLFKSYGYLNILVGNYDKSIHYLDSALLYVDSNDLSEKRMVMGLFIRANLREKGGYMVSLANLFKKEIDEAVLRETIDLETKYEVAEKNKRIEQYRTKQIAEQYLKKKRQLFYVLLILGIGGIATFLTIYFQYQKYKTKQKINDLHAQSLRLQINPHFFFNALNSINAYIGENKHLEAKRYLSKFAKVMRAALESVHNPISTIEEEFHFVQTYLDVQKMQYKYFDYEIEIEDGVEVSKLAIPALIIQPYLENAIIHGFKNKTTEDKGIIKVKVFEESNSKIIISIADNGTGINYKSKHDRTHKSLAMSINQKRLHVFSSKHSKVTISSKTNQGVQVELVIPKVEAK